MAKISMRHKLPQIVVFSLHLSCLNVYATTSNEYAAFTIEKSSLNNVYRATIFPLQTSVPIGELHSWVFHFATEKGETFIPKQLVGKDGMPGHGFPVEPEISSALGNGKFLIQDVKFNMTGDWQLRLGVNGSGGWDTITFQLSITYPNEDIIPQAEWSVSEIATIIKSLSLSEFTPSKPDPSSRYSSNNIAAAFGKKLFFDPQLSQSGTVSCATCHQPEKRFSDGKRLALGRFISAFEHTLELKLGRFDRFFDLLRANKVSLANQVLSRADRAGLKLFLNAERTLCLRCHYSPLFTNRGFHKLGTGIFEGRMSDFGRCFGLQFVAHDIFNFEGPFSDADPEQCVSLRFIIRSEIPALMQGAFKVPSLRNVVDTAPYLHDGRYASLADVINHYRKPQGQMSELNPIALCDQEANQLEAFLRTLSEQSRAGANHEIPKFQRPS